MMYYPLSNTISDLRYTLLMLPIWLLATGSVTYGQTPVYDMDLKVDPEVHQLVNDLTLTVPLAYFEGDTLRMMIARDARFDMIEANAGAKVTTNQEGEGPQMIVVALGKNRPDQVVIRMNYSLEIPVDHQINRITPTWVELNIDSFWQPFITSFPAFTYTVRLDLDTSFRILTGDLKKQKKGITVLQSRFPRVDIPFCASPTFTTSRSDYVQVYASSEDIPADSVALFADRALTYLEGYIDEPADFKVPRIIAISPRKDVGYSRKNYIVLSKIKSVSAQGLSAYLAHEFSHYWFSEALLSSKHHWLTESFAEYMSNIYIRKAFGQEAFEDEMAEKRERIKEEPKTLADFEGRPSYLAMYHKGPLVLAGFEDHIGRTAFRQFINDFIDHNVKTNEELFDLIRETLGSEALAKMKELRASI